jgi:hypothetical protein
MPKDFRRPATVICPGRKLTTGTHLKCGVCRINETARRQRAYMNSIGTGFIKTAIDIKFTIWLHAVNRLMCNRVCEITRLKPVSTTL